MPRLTTFCVALICCGLCSAAAGQTRLDLPASAEEEFRDPLEAASLVLRPSEEPRTSQDLVAAAQADYARLLGALYDRGHFAGQISITVNGVEAARLSPFTAPAQINSIILTVEPGPAFQLGRAEIGPLAPGDAPIEGFTTGAPANVPILRQAAQSAIEAWRDDGHATAEIANQNLQAINRQATLNAQIVLRPGPQLRFGALNVDGLERLNPQRFQEIAGLPTGTTFSTAELNRASERLRRSGVFSSVSLTEGTVRPDGTIDIDAAIVEAPLRRFGFGAELSSTEGGTLSAFWLHRNLSGNGDRLRFDAEISGIGQDAGNPDFEVVADFSRPASATPDTTFTATARLAYQNEDTFESNLFEISAGAEQIITENLSGEARIGLRFNDISDDLGDRQVTLLTLPLGLTWDNRDDPLNATTGFFGDLDLIPFYAVDGGEFGTRFTLDARAYRGFGENNETVLAARMQFGSVFGGDFQDLPPDYLFFSGGGGTVRGQDFRSLGAIQDGIDAGGRGFFGISTELRRSFTDTLGAVAFVDAGYVSSDPLFDDSGEWHSGAGLGLRYQTGIGAIRLDLAAPIDGPEDSQSAYIYIGIGQSF